MSLLLDFAWKFICKCFCKWQRQEGWIHQKRCSLCWMCLWTPKITVFSQGHFLFSLWFIWNIDAKKLFFDIRHKDGTAYHGAVYLSLQLETGQKCFYFSCTLFLAGCGRPSPTCTASSGCRTPPRWNSSTPPTGGWSSISTRIASMARPKRWRALLPVDDAIVCFPSSPPLFWSSYSPPISGYS